jgi:hypothetical protein
VSRGHFPPYIPLCAVSPSLDCYRVDQAEFSETSAEERVAEVDIGRSAYKYLQSRKLDRLIGYE